MTAPAATLATFAHFEIIRTRKVARFLFEVPIEKADEALAALGGLPRSDDERWVAIARLVTDKQGMARPSDIEAAMDTVETAGRDTAPPAAEPPEAEAQGRDKPRRAFHTLRRSQQAGMLCADERFQDWADQHLPYLGGGCGIPAAERTAQQIRVRCGVKSRAELDTDAGAARLWDAAVRRFRADTGQMAEER